MCAAFSSNPAPLLERHQRGARARVPALAASMVPKEQNARDVTDPLSAVAELVDLVYQDCVMDVVEFKHILELAASGAIIYN